MRLKTKLAKMTKRPIQKSRKLKITGLHNLHNIIMTDKRRNNEQDQEIQNAMKAAANAELINQLTKIRDENINNTKHIWTHKMFNHRSIVDKLRKEYGDYVLEHHTQMFNKFYAKTVKEYPEFVEQHITTTSNDVTTGTCVKCNGENRTLYENECFKCKFSPSCDHISKN